MVSIKETFVEYKRVFRITKKPSMQEFRSIVQVSGAGILIIGMIGFLIQMIINFGRV